MFKKKKNTSKGKYAGNYKLQYNFMFLLFLTDLIRNYIKQHVYNCIIGPITYRKVIYLTVVTRSEEERASFWSKEMI